MQPGDPLAAIQQWKRDIYYIQLQAPKPKKIECHIDIPSRPIFYGKEFHGEISRHEADELLLSDGCYLVRESQRNPGCYTLAIRFENATKNYKLYYDVNLQQHYVGDKYFDNLDDLVADGLICFYVHLKAPGYIASMNTGDESHYDESPYMRYRNDMMTRRTNRPTLVGTRSQSPAAQASASSQLSHQSTFHQSPPSLPTQPPHRLSSQLPGRNLATAGIATPVLPPRSSVFNSSVGVPPPTPTTEPPARRLSSDGPDGPRFIPSGKQAGDWMDIMQQEKTHNFKTTTFKSLANCWCEFCFHFMWGLIQQGVECQDCGFRAHKKCSEKLPNDCMPTMKKLKRMFGLDLTTLLKATNKSIPYVVEKCIEEIENRVCHTKYLFIELVIKMLLLILVLKWVALEEIRKAFDLDGDADITEHGYEDIATITSVLKLFFRQLPVPLITFEVYPKLTAAVTNESLIRDVLVELKSALILLPTSHFQTLKVSQLQNQNMMSAENLSIIFAPTILQSPQSDPISAMTIGKVEARAIEALIVNYSFIFER
ncbi:CHN1 [Bugula neritina]|uniref:CHN1 n=1 Tax=Bugula neritina TaxID=10212 RepID=A0A7J7J0F4_BUGNE|nr:CHN1 [Bugula neritina]